MPETQHLIFETQHWKVLLAHDQEILGRSIIVCQDDVGEMGLLSHEQWLDFADVAKRLEAAAKLAFGATMCNWTCLMNGAYRHTPPDPRVHWHFRPRYKTTVQFAGLEFKDEEFGSHYARDTDRDVGNEVMEKITEAYKKSLDK